MKKIILMFALASMIYSCECRQKSTCESLLDQREHLVRYDSNNASGLTSVDSMIVRCHCGEPIKDSTIIN